MERHLNYLLQSNDPPSDATITEIDGLLQETTTDLLEVEAKIDGLDKIMQRLREKRQKIQSTISDYNTILSPARRLPIDILHEIFFYCLPTHRNSIMDASEAPMLLTRVCSSWRSIALSSPWIWSKLHIPLPGSPRDTFLRVPADFLDRRNQAFAHTMERRCEVVKRWLERSGSCPLSLSISYPSYHSFPDDVDDVDLTHDMFQTVLVFARRWKNLELSMPYDVYERLQASITVDMLPMLENLRANIHERGRSDLADKPIVLLTSPQLRKLSLHSTKASWNFHQLPTKMWSRLTYLCFHSTFPDTEILDLLEQCCNLVDCKLLILRRWGEDPYEPTQSTILLPHLQSLSINDAGSNIVMTKVFKALSAPGLKTIEYQRSPYYPPDTEDPAPVPISLFTLLESSPVIERLMLEPNGVLPQDILRCLRIATHATHLVLGHEPLSAMEGRPMYPHPLVLYVDQFDLTNLTVAGVGPDSATEEEAGAEVLLPNLETLEAYQLSSFTDDNLLRLIISRVDGWKEGKVRALKRVRLEFQRQKQKDIRAAVSEHAKEAGMEVTLDLIYLMEQPRNVEPLSSSFGLGDDGRSWNSLDIVETIVY